MREEVRGELFQMMDDYFHEDEALRVMLQTFLEEKIGEGLRWSEITIQTHHLLGGKSDKISRAAAMTELVILALDVIDDLQDEDNMDKPWMKCPSAYVLNAVLAYVTLFMGQLGLLAGSPAGRRSDIVKQIGSLLAHSITGQHADVSAAVRTEDEYLTMVQRKSGSLVRLACLMGCAFLEDATPETIAGMDELANCIGTIAQIQNDLKDVLRFDLKNDLLQKKRTLPILFLLQDSEQEFPILHRYYDGQISADEFLQHKLACVRYIHESGCLEYTNIIQAMLTEKAEQLLERLPAAAEKKEQFKRISFAAEPTGAAS